MPIAPRFRVPDQTTSFAHSENPAGEWHALTAHLEGVAKLAREFAEPLGAPEVGYLLGLWHDVGKFHPQFQQYLRDEVPRGGDHRAAGAVLAAQHLGVAAMAIQAHHGGLQSLAEFKIWLHGRMNDPAVDAAIKRAKAELQLEEPTNKVPMPDGLDKARRLELFLRLLFSALVDADFLDTEKHFKPAHALARGSDITLDTLWEPFEAAHRKIMASAPDPRVNRVRREVYEACSQAAQLLPGFFRLTVPTGGGKTLSGMAFALQHALLHHQRQVIVAVPFITITQQTAKTYRDIFKQPDAVLEHHSGTTAPTGEPDEYAPDDVWKRLAAENWDAPVVVTTTVQLFESLFSNRVSTCRKLHRLANSVIILDEAQALPAQLLEPILEALRDLVEQYGTTVVLSTATQPAFETLPIFRNLAPREIVSQFADHFAALKRVDYHWPGSDKLDWAQVADRMRGAPQSLAIVNTKRDALALLDALSDSEALHLSTLLCGAHRSAVLQDLRTRLKTGQPCRLVSTQVVEAGVDIDFPLVLRALAPLDRVIQAAGRCNREGSLPQLGQLIVFEPAEGGMPQGTYRAGYDNTRAMLAAGQVDPDDPVSMTRYFTRFFQTVDTDAKRIQPWRDRDSLNYPKVAEQFRMIDDDTVTLVVQDYPEPQNREVLALIEQLKHEPGQGRRLLRELQPYTVALFRGNARRLPPGRIEPLVGDTVYVWHGKYDPLRGIVDADPEYFA